MELPGRSKRGRAKRRYINVMKVDMQRVGMTEEDFWDRVRQRQMICCVDL